jgi:TM2 domain-containing membrane protein YozV
MHCRNCGKQVDNNAAVCLGCGVPPLSARHFCWNCGAQTLDAAIICTSCGVQLTHSPVGEMAKSRLAAGLLGILLGYLGIHRFYLGYTGIGIAQLLISVLSCGVLTPVTWLWGLIEGIMILTGSISTDAAGRPLKE